MSQERGQFSDQDTQRNYPRRAYSDAQIEEIVDKGPRNAHEEAIERSYWIGANHGEHRGYNKRKNEGDPFPTAEVITTSITWVGAIAIALIVAYVVLRIVGLLPGIFT